jgi:unsaturated chondroitin disaccharide hydrolase
MNKLNRFFASGTVALTTLALLGGCRSPAFSPVASLQYCVGKVAADTAAIRSYDRMPRDIDSGKTAWNVAGNGDWTCGFFPGILWFTYEYTDNPAWKAKADSFTRPLTQVAFRKNFDHDLGFMLYNSFGKGYRLTGDTMYKRVLLAAADSLATLFNPRAGTILSWPGMRQKMGWPHNTIIDNMMNLELLFWAAKNGGERRLYDIAVKHAETTMQNHFRPDYSAYHVVVYDTVTGKKIKGVTNQGYSDSSMWARGQSWAIYGYTMVYRETRDPRFLDFAQKVADIYLKRLPEDRVPYWDFDDPAIPRAPRDASAAAVTASALLELSGYVRDSAKAGYYRAQAVAMLKALSVPPYRSGDANSAFLLHATGNLPAHGEIDASIIYADYYYMEALLRLRKLENGHTPGDH